MQPQTSRFTQTQRSMFARRPHLPCSCIQSNFLGSKAHHCPIEAARAFLSPAIVQFLRNLRRNLCFAQPNNQPGTFSDRAILPIQWLWQPGRIDQWHLTKRRHLPLDHICGASFPSDSVAAAAEKILSYNDGQRCHHSLMMTSCFFSNVYNGGAPTSPLVRRAKIGTEEMAVNDALPPAFDVDGDMPRPRNVLWRRTPTRSTAMTRRRGG